MVAKSKRQLAKLALLLLALLLVVTAVILLCVFLIPRHHRKPLPPGSSPGNASNPDDSVVAFDFSPYLIMYKSGRVHRLDGTARCSAGVDADTGVTSKDVVIDGATGLAARMYLPSATAGGGTRGSKKEDPAGGRLPVLVFYHGGAFVIESAFTPLYHAYLNAVAAKAGVVAVSVEYRLAPEHRLPVAYDDSWRALNWVARNAASGPEPWLRDRGNISRLFVAGDSAGANIAHNMAMRAGTEGGLDGGAAILGLLLLDPYFWGKEPVAGETTDKARRRQYEATWSFICGGRYGIDDPLVNPLSLPAAELRRLASSRVAVTSSGLDDFRPRGLAYAAALNGSGWGGAVEQYETPGERHVYFLDRPKDPNSVKELAFVTGFLSRE
jgi:acetyl esterase/lipase